MTVRRVLFFFFSVFVFVCFRFFHWNGKLDLMLKRKNIALICENIAFLCNNYNCFSNFFSCFAKVQTK